MTPEDVLCFWFGPRPHGAGALRRASHRWFDGGEPLDREIGTRFAATVACAARGDLDIWQGSPRGRLALILLLDQFSRHIFRGTARAYAQDQRALGLCLEGLRRGHDQALSPIEQLFFLMPLLHAEDARTQERSVVCFAALARSAPPPEKAFFHGWARTARRQRLIIRLCGRFPHRNRILGRDSKLTERLVLLAGGLRRPRSRE